MEAAAHTPGGYGGVPQSVGNEFVSKDDERGKLTEKEQREADKDHKERKDMPASAFLEGASRKYPVKAQRDGEWKYDRDLLLAAEREANMHGHHDLAAKAKSILNREFGTAKDERRIAFDKSVRTYDQDGRLQIKLTNLSKANVCPYFGSEIPNAEALGLDAERQYMLLRHPDELAKAAPTFNGLPLLNTHIPHSAADPQKDSVVGSTGSSAQFVAPYLMNSLVVWDGDAIAGIENNEQRELSCGYYYKADMTPGEYEGEPYDGVMRDIVGNHVALVEAGRAGPDVMVGDSTTGELNMSKKPLSRKAMMIKGALTAFLHPRLATDAKVDLNPILADVAADNWKNKRPGVIAAVTKACAGKLAQDDELDHLPELLEALERDKDNDADIGEAAEGMLEDGLSEEEEKQFQDLLARRKKTAEDEEEDDDKKDEAKAEDESDKEDDKVDKGAMDAAIKKAAQDAETQAIARIRGITEAEKVVQPYVGEITAQDSAENVYKVALDMLGVDVAGVHPSAYRAILTAQPKPGSQKPAFDAKSANDSVTKFPEVARIRQL